MKISWLSTLATVALLAACGPKPAETPDPAPAPVAAAPAQPAAPAAATPAGPDAEQLAQIAEGRDVAVLNCSRCHALDASDDSPRSDAPPMHDMLARYDAEALAEDLIEGIKLGHEDMPQFDFSVIEADALIAYLRSIRTPSGDL